MNDLYDTLDDDYNEEELELLNEFAHLIISVFLEFLLSLLMIIPLEQEITKVTFLFFIYQLN